MRSTILSFAILAIAGSAVLSCSKENKFEDNSFDKAPKSITVNVISGEGTTKTMAVDGDVPTIEWVSTDKISLFEIVDGEVKGKAESGEAVISDNMASFSATLGWEAQGSSYKYSAVYPADNVFSYGGLYYIIMPEEQVLTGNNFSEDSDILFSTPLDHGNSRVEDGEDILFRFRRLGTVVRLNLVGMSSGEKIQAIKLIAPANIAGSIVYDPVTSTVDPDSAFDDYASDTVTLYLDDFEATGNDVVWFRVIAERDWAIGDQFTVRVTTDSNVYEKEVTLPSEIKFPDGGVTKFGVNIASSVVPAMAVPCTWDFEEGADYWTFIDSDGDGKNWYLNGDGDTTSGALCLSSASWDNESGALTPDNWAFTPRVQLTESNYLSFWINAEDIEFQDEHFAVYIAKGSPEGEITTLIPETVFPEVDYVELGYEGLYVHCIVQIPQEFDNEVVCIGFRHFNCTDMYLLDIDDVSITEEYPYQPPQAQYSDYLGQWTTGSRVFTIEQKADGESYTVSGFSGQTYPVEAKFEGNNMVVYDQVINTEEDNYAVFQGLFSRGGYLNYYDYTEGANRILFVATYDAEQDALIIRTANTYSYYIWITYYAEDIEIGNYASIPAVLTPYVPGGDDDPNTYLFKDGFEDGLNAWTLFDADGDGMNWKVLTQEGYSHSGEGCLWGISYNNGTSYYPDNYAFTPAITLTSNNYVSLWVMGYNQTYVDHYGIFIMTSAPNADNLGECEMLYEADASSLSYEKIEIPIPSKYDGQTVYIAVRHFDSGDNFYVFIDDFAVTEGPLVSQSSSSAPAYFAQQRLSKGAGMSFLSGTDKVRRAGGRTGSLVLSLPSAVSR